MWCFHHTSRTVLYILHSLVNLCLKYKFFANYFFAELPQFIGFQCIPCPRRDILGGDKLIMAKKRAFMICA